MPSVQSLEDDFCILSLLAEQLTDIACERFQHKSAWLALPVGIIAVCYPRFYKAKGFFVGFATPAVKSDQLLSVVRHDMLGLC